MMTLELRAGGWLHVSDQLPELDVPVWLSGKDWGPIIGMRASSTDGWLWADCCWSHYWTDDGWRSSSAEPTDFEPEAWLALPEHPNASPDPLLVDLHASPAADYAGLRHQYEMLAALFVTKARMADYWRERFNHAQEAANEIPALKRALEAAQGQIAPLQAGTADSQQPNRGVSPQLSLDRALSLLVELAASTDDHTVTDRIDHFLETMLPLADHPGNPAAGLSRIEAMCRMIDVGEPPEPHACAPASRCAAALDDQATTWAGKETGAPEPRQEPCGGCGATREDQRCIGCMHPFQPDPVPKAVRELLAALNRDGGQRQQEVGVDQAATEALAEFNRLQHALASGSDCDASNAACRVVDDAGTSMLPNPLRGRPGEVKRCPRGPHAPGADCSFCGGSGLRRICNLTACNEYGCQGSGYCSVAAE